MIYTYIANNKHIAVCICANNSYMGVSTISKDKPGAIWINHFSVPEAAAAPADEFVQDHYLIHTFVRQSTSGSPAMGQMQDQFMNIFTTSTIVGYIYIYFFFFLKLSAAKCDSEINVDFSVFESKQTNNSSIVTERAPGLQPKHRSFQILWQLKGLKGPRTHSCPRCWKKTLLQHHFVLSASPVPNAEENTTVGRIGWWSSFSRSWQKKTSGDVVSAKMHMELSRAPKMILIDIQSRSNILLGQIIVPNEVHDITLHPHPVHFHPKFMNLKNSLIQIIGFSSTITLTTIWL